MNIFYIKKMNKTAMPARLGEISGIVHPMPINLSNSAKMEHPIFSEEAMKILIQNDQFLKFITGEIGCDDEALLQIFNQFVLEDEEYSEEYKNICQSLQ